MGNHGNTEGTEVYGSDGRKELNRKDRRGDAMGAKKNGEEHKEIRVLLGVFASPLRLCR